MNHKYSIEDFKIPFEEAKGMHNNFFRFFRNRKSTKHVDFLVKDLKEILGVLEDDKKISFILAAHLRNSDVGLDRYKKKTWAEGKIETKEELKNRVTLIIKIESKKSVGALSYDYYDAGAVCPPPPGCNMEY